MSRILTCLFLLVTLTALLPGCHEELPAADGSSPDFAALDELGGVQAARRDAELKLRVLAEQYAIATDTDSVRLSAARAEVLEELRRAEGEVGLITLLDGILAERRHIAALELRIAEIARALPVPTVVRVGDTHRELAMQFLQNTMGLSEERAAQQADRALLTSHLAPGMHVWQFWTGSGYGTAVTQGDSDTSPSGLMTGHLAGLRRKVADAMSARDAAEGEVASLQGRMEELEARSAAEADLRARIVAERDRAEAARAALWKDESTLRYAVATPRELRKDRMLSPLGSRLADWEPEAFTEQLDVRYERVIHLRPEAVGLKRIKRVQLLPQERWTEGEDYEVSLLDGGRSGSVELLDPSPFRDAELYVVLR